MLKILNQTYFCSILSEKIVLNRLSNYIRLSKIDYFPSKYSLNRLKYFKGACEGTLSCSTCHLILKKEDYDQLKPPSDEENDMLDLAFGLSDT